MSPRFIILTGLFIGSTIGGYFPMLWGESAFSGVGILGNFIGGALGIWLGYKISRNL